MDESDRTLGDDQKWTGTFRQGDEPQGPDPGHTFERSDEPDDPMATQPTIVRGGASASAQPMPRAGNSVPLRPGTRLGSYVLIEQLGEGAQGSVWRAHNEVADRDFALKFLTAGQNRNEAAVRSMRSEAAVLFTLTHSSIVRLNNIEQVGGHLFLVMELIEGPSIHALLSKRLPSKGGKRRGFTRDECLWLIEQLAPALDYAASQKVTHRDIKPANLMLTAQVDPERPLTESNAQVKLCDFGIAIVELGTAKPDRVRVAGTLPYMAPEVLNGDKPTTQSDVYSLAATVYALHRGDPPYKGGTIAEMMKRHSEGVLQPLESGNKAFDAAVLKALSKRPEDRQATFDDFLFDASGGRLGRRAALRARGQRRATVAASILAVTAVGYALDPFGVRRGQAKFALGSSLVIREGVPVVREGAQDLDFTYSSPGDEEVEVWVDGGKIGRVVPIKPGEDRYRVGVTLDGHGLHDVELRGTDRGSLVGQQRYFVDTEVELADQPIRLPGGDVPYEVQSPVPVDFYIDEENVKVWDVTAGASKLLELELDGARARANLTIEADPERETWQVLRRFRLEDPLGNTFDGEVEFRAVDSRRILGRIQAVEPTPVEDVHLWDIPQQLESIVELEADLQAVGELIALAKREELLQAAQQRRAALAAKLKAAPDPTIEWSLGVTAEGRFVVDDGSDVPLLYTRNSSPELRGRVQASRSNQLEASAKGLEIGVRPVIERESGDFRLVVTLDRDVEGSVTLALPDNGPIKSLRLEYDPDPPSITLESPSAGGVVARSAFAVEAKVEDSSSGVADVELTVSGQSHALEVSDGGRGVWRGEISLPAEGVNSCQISARDRVGNLSVHQFTLSRDTTAPSWSRGTEDPPAASTADDASMLFEFDEPIARASAEWTLYDDAGKVVDQGSFPKAEVEPGQSYVRYDIRLPFRECSRLEVVANVEDAVGNEQRVSVTRAVEHDPWGAVPDWMRTKAQVELDVAKLRELLGPELGTAENRYVTELDGRRFPRCIRHRDSGIEFVFVRGGRFRYGESGAEVEMSGFYIARTEVSRKQFHSIGGLEGYPRDGSESSDLPILTNRADAGQWCGRQQFKLPTEAQWEFAASGPDNPDYPWGNEPDSTRSNEKSSGSALSAKAAAVDAYPDGRSWCGALQMAGNLSEICRDDLDPAMVVAGTRDPLGSVDAKKLPYRVRGSSWTSSDPELEKTFGRATHGSPNAPLAKRSGFRPVWEVKPD